VQQAFEGLEHFRRPLAKASRNVGSGPPRFWGHQHEFLESPLFGGMAPPLITLHPAAPAAGGHSAHPGSDTAQANAGSRSARATANCSPPKSHWPPATTFIAAIEFGLARIHLDLLQGAVTATGPGRSSPQFVRHPFVPLCRSSGLPPFTQTHGLYWAPVAGTAGARSPVRWARPPDVTSARRWACRGNRSTSLATIESINQVQGVDHGSIRLNGRILVGHPQAWTCACCHGLTASGDQVAVRMACDPVRDAPMADCSTTMLRVGVFRSASLALHRRSWA